MLTYIGEQVAPLTVAAGALTTAFSGNVSTLIKTHDLEQYRYQQVAGASLAHGTDRCAIANELVISFTKTQGSANQIQIQVTESDTEAFTIANVVLVKGSPWVAIATSEYDDTTVYRLDPIAVRCKYVRISARYSGGSEASAALTVYHKLYHNEQSWPGSFAIAGGSGAVADVRTVDRVADEGLCYSAAIAVSAGTWLADVVTFTTTAHAWVAGDIITVSGCGNASYNGTYTVVSAATNTWTAALVGDPGAFTTAGSALQAQATTRLVDETKSWTANEWSNLGAYVEISSGTGVRQYKLITSNGTHWLAFAAMAVAPVTSDSTYNVVETGVRALVCDTELSLTVGSITVTNIDAYRYIAAPPDLAGGESSQGRCDVKGNLQVVGPEAHGAAAARAPVLTAGYASSTLPAAVDAADVCRLWLSLNGSIVVSGYNEDPVTPITALLPIGTDNVACAQAAPQLVRTGGEARASGGLLTEGDSALFSTDLYGGLRVGGGAPHNAAAVGNPVVIGGKATASIPTAADENDAVNTWHNLSGIMIVGGFLEDGGLNYGVGIPIGTDNAVATDAAPDLVKIGGEARAAGAAYTEGDSAILSTDLYGSLRVGGGSGHGVASNANPIIMGGFGSANRPTATDANDSTYLWTSLTGAVAVMGLCEDAAGTAGITLAMGIDNAVGTDTTPDFALVGGRARASGAAYTEADSAVVSFDLLGCLRIAGGQPWDSIASASVNPLMLGAFGSYAAPTAVSGDADVTHLWSDRCGALVIAGFDVTAAITKQLHIATDDSAMPATPLFLPIGGEYRATPVTYTDGDATVLQTTINGALLTTGGTGGGAPIANVATVAVTGTEVPLAADQAVTAGFAVVVKAKHTNTGVIYVGPNGVTNATGHQLYPGESVDLHVRNLNLVYVDADVGGEGVTFIVEGA